MADEYNWHFDVPQKKTLFKKNAVSNTEFLLNDIGVFRADRTSRTALLWRKITAVEGDGESKILVRGNADTELELYAKPEKYAEILAFIEKMRAKNPLQKEADPEAACWYCFGFDDEWDAGYPLAIQIRKEIETRDERHIEDDEESLEATVIP